MHCSVFWRFASSFLPNTRMHCHIQWTVSILLIGYIIYSLILNLIHFWMFYLGVLYVFGVQSLKSCLTDSFMTPWTVALQAPQSMEFSRQEHWRGLPFPSPEDLPDPGIEPICPALQVVSLPLSHRGSPAGPVYSLGLLPHPLQLVHPPSTFCPVFSSHHLIQCPNSQEHNQLWGADGTQICPAQNLQSFNCQCTWAPPQVLAPLKLNSTGPTLTSSSLAPCIFPRLTVSPRQQNVGASLTAPSL